MQRYREWIIVAVLGIGLAAMGVYASDRNDAAEAATERARVAETRADSLSRVAREAIARAQEIDRRLVEQLDAQRAEILDSIAAIPPVRVSTAVQDFETIAETFDIPVEVLEAGQELVERVRELEAAVVERDRIIALFPAQLAQRDTVWERRMAEKDRIITSLRTALEASEADADQWKAAAEEWENAAGVGFWGELKRAAFWSAIGYGLNELIGSDGGSTVVIQDTPRGCSGCKG